MKKLVFILIIVLSSSVFAFAADNSIASAWLDFEAYKNHSLPNDAPSNWDYSIRVIDYIQSDAGRTVNNEGEEIVVDKKLLSSKYTHFFDVVYTSNSVFYPVKISVQVKDFENETGSTIEVHTKYEPSWQWTNEYESAEILTNYGWSFSGIDKNDLENDIKDYSAITEREVEDNSPAGFDIGIPYNSSFRAVFHDGGWFGDDWHELKGFVPIYWDNCFKTENKVIYNIYYYRHHYADIEYKIKTSISCPSLPENDTGKYYMPVTISVETDL